MVPRYVSFLTAWKAIQTHGAPKWEEKMRSFVTNAWPAPWNYDIPLKDTGPSFLSISIPHFPLQGISPIFLSVFVLVTQAIDVLSQKMYTQVYYFRMLSR